MGPDAHLFHDMGDGAMDSTYFKISSVVCFNPTWNPVIMHFFLTDRVEKV